MTKRQEVVLRFVVTRGVAVRPNEVVYENREAGSPLPPTWIAAKKTLHELHQMGLLRKVGRSVIEYEALPEAKSLV